MNLKDEFKCMVGAYYGVREIDEYDLKVYVLKDIENYIKDFLSITPIPNFDYYKEAEIIENKLSLKTKLQDALIILHRMNASMELILIIKRKLRNIKDNDLKKI